MPSPTQSTEVPEEAIAIYEGIPPAVPWGELSETGRDRWLLAYRVIAPAIRNQERQRIQEALLAEIHKRRNEQKHRIGMSSHDTELRAMHGATILQNLADWVAALDTLDPSGGQGAEKQAADEWERVAPADLQAGDVIRLDVFDLQEGWNRERRQVLGDDGRTFRMRGYWDDEDREYDWTPAEDKHCNGQHSVQRVIERLKSTVPATDPGKKSS